ncbi:SpoIIE family protein phosphatase [Streptomyces sp. NPDC056400]|uniref:SpoIIE family protein phosphatase n=1 Tax=Streptomyces sp. NPDC056400 TaxID=3345808 RepID=UPI0035DEA420
MVEGTEASVVILDQELRYLYVNPAWARASGMPVAAFRGRTLSQVLPSGEAADEVVRRVLEDGRPRETTVAGPPADSSSHPGRRLWRGTFHRLEADGQVLGVCGIGVEVSNLRRYLSDLERVHQRLALLDTAATRIGTTLNAQTTCTELADFLVPSLADAVGVGTLVEEEPGTGPLSIAGMLRLRIMAVSAAQELRRYLLLLGVPGDHLDIARGHVVRNCMNSGRPWLANHASDDLMRKVTPVPERVGVWRSAGIHSLLLVPLPTTGRSVGAMLLGRAGASAPFSDEDILTAQGLATRAAVAIDSAHRYTTEHTMARELQAALLSEPDSPHPDVEVATRYLPSGRSALVGGDWYDSIPLPDGRTLLVMGDVMGHGFQAAVAMSQYRALLRTVAATGATVDAILSEVDRRVVHIGLDRAATCLLVLMDPRAGTCTLASAGHLPPVMLRSGYPPEVLWVTAGPPLGTELGDYEATTMPIAPGTVLLLYTDGLVEERGTDIDVSLQAFTRLRLTVDGSLEDLLDTLLAQLAIGVREDDVALLAARRRSV